MKERFTHAIKLVEDLPTDIKNTDSHQLRNISKRIYKSYNDASMDDASRYRIILGIVESRFTPALPLLKKAILKDSSALVRHEAATGIAEMEGVKAQPLLIKALKDPHGLVRHEAADMLGGIGNRKAIKALESLLDDPDTGAYVAGTARVAIQMIEHRLKKEAGNRLRP